MRKRIALMLTLLMVLMMFGSTTFAEEGVDVFPLLAGQDMEVGTVEVSNDGEFIYVKYILDSEALDDGWLIYETHVHVGTEASDFPLNKKNNPQVGLFDYGMEHDGVEDYEEAIPMVDFEPGDNLFIAAHAVIEIEEETHEEDTSFYIVSNIDDTHYKNGDVWDNAVLAWVHDSWKDTYGSTPFGANWVWNSEYVSDPVNGEIVEFKHDFNVYGTPTSATLTIITDNSYKAYINDDYVGADGDWKDAEVYDVEVVEGSNTLEVTAVNAPQDNGTPTSNPAGLVYRIDVEASKTVVDIEYANESAWAEGERFVERGNWATYFEYTVHGEKLVDTVSVPSKGGVVYSSIELIEGQMYRLEASGTFDYSSDTYDEADAEWFEKPGGWIIGEEGKYEEIPYVLDVMVNGDLNNPVNVDWGDYNPEHIYSMNFEGEGASLSFFIFDTNYDDNSGFITVDIYKVW